MRPYFHYPLLYQTRLAPSCPEIATHFVFGANSIVRSPLRSFSLEQAHDSTSGPCQLTFIGRFDTLHFTFLHFE
jgi:hypothetical protein